MSDAAAAGLEDEEAATATKGVAAMAAIGNKTPHTTVVRETATTTRIPEQGA